MRRKSKKLPHIGIDVMGGDTDPSLITQSLLPILSSLQDQACFFLFGTKSCLSQVHSSSYVFTKIASEFIEMEDHPLLATRKKKNSSLSIGIQSLKNQEIDAFISMGNTGALVISSRSFLGTLPHLSHPALLANIPSQKKNIAVLDVGATIEYKSTDLIEFAAMGIAYQKNQGIREPKVGLLNVGTEPLKGSVELQKAYLALSTISKSYPYPFFIGNIEGKDVFHSDIDVLVTGGFAGNIFLKTSEGVMLFLTSQIPSLPTAMQKKLDYAFHSGAVLCGINGLVIKCHGNANTKALEQSILCAINWIEKDFISTIQEETSLFFSSFH